MKITNLEKDSKPTKSKTSRYGIPLFVFFAVTFVFFSIRVTLPVTVTDTEFIGATSPINEEELYGIFSGISLGRWYRPMEGMLVNTMLTYWTDDLPFMMLVNATIAGGVATLVYLLVKELLEQQRFEHLFMIQNHEKKYLSGLFRNKTFISFCVSTLFIFSMPVIETTWLFIHKSILSDFFILLSVFSYLRYENTKSTKWLAIMIVGGILAPWARETAASVGLVLALTVFAIAFLERKRDIKLLACVSLIAFHSFYPTFFSGLIFHHTIYLVSIMERAAEGAAGLSLGGLFNIDSIGNYDIPFRLSLFLSPITIVLSFFSMAVYCFSAKSRAANISGILVLIVLLLSIISLYTGFLYKIIPFLFLFTMLIPSWKVFGKLLPIWVLIPLPTMYFFHVFDAWLKPAAVPFIILTLLWIVRLPIGINTIINVYSRTEWTSHIPTKLYNMLKTNASKSQLISLLSCFFVLLMIFQISNLIMANNTFREASDTHLDIARFLAINTNKGDAFVANLRQTRDIGYYTNDYITAYLAYFQPYFPPAGGRDFLLHELPRHLKERAFDTYVLINEKWGKIGYGQVFPDENIQHIADFDATCYYPVLDPSMWALPEHLKKFGGPSDLLHNYEINTYGFIGQCHAEYALYKYIAGNRALVDSINKEDVILARDGLIEENYKGYNIIGHLGKFYAIPQPEGRFDVNRVVSGGYSQTHIENSLNELKKIINESTPIGPYLALGNYNGFNILSYGGIYYAIPNDGGGFEYEKVISGGYRSVYVAKSVAIIQHAIDNPNQPYLVEEDYNGYDIYGHADRFIAIPTGEGLDLNKENSDDHGKFIVYKKLIQLKEKIDEYIQTKSNLSEAN